MHPEYNAGRRRARAKALTDLHANDSGSRYVDAAEYASRDGFTVVAVNAAGETRAAASTGSKQPEEAEEIAIALAIVDPGCRTVLSDSRQAVKNYARGRISPAAARILHQKTESDRCVRIKWFPAHAGKVSENNDNRNETAHSRARELTDRAVGACERLWFSTRDRMTSFHEITKAYRMARRTLPPPCKGLSREQAVIYRQLQTRTIPSPALKHKMYPEAHPDDKCRVCRKEVATLEHIVWDCINFPTESVSGKLPPAMEEATRQGNQDLQIEAVQRVIVALARQESGGPGTASRAPAAVGVRKTT